MRLVVDVGSGAIAEQIAYAEFGVTIASPTFEPFGFAGGVHDQDTMLTRFGARDYDADLARWAGKDAMGFNGGAPNLFSYALNDPIHIVDMYGLSTITFDRSEGAIYIYPGGSDTYGPPQQFPAGNNTVNPTGDPLTPESWGPAPNGTFPTGPVIPQNGGPDSSFGAGFAPIRLAPGPNGQRRGVGLHAGRANVGPTARTKGCIRTTFAAIGVLITDPPTEITIQE